MAYNRILTLLCIQALIYVFLFIPITFAQLDSSWTLTVGGQSVQANADGSFRIPNVSAPDLNADFEADDFVRLQGYSDKNGQRRYVFSDYFKIVSGETVVVPRLTFTNSPPIIPEILRVEVGDSPIIVGTEITKQLIVLASTNEGNEEVDVTSRSRWTYYRSSNPKIATISDDGLVTSKSPGRVYISTFNEGVTAVVGIQINDQNSVSTVEGYVVLDDGQPVENAELRIRGSIYKATSDLNGRFVFENIGELKGIQFIDCIRLVDGEVLHGHSHGVSINNDKKEPIDAGIITIKPRSFDFSVTKEFVRPVTGRQTFFLEPNIGKTICTLIRDPVDRWTNQSKNSFALSDAETGDTEIIPIGSGIVASATKSPDGKRIYFPIGTRSGNISTPGSPRFETYDVVEKKFLPSLRLPGRFVNSCVVTPDGKKIYLTERVEVNRVIVIDAENLSILKTIRAQEGPRDVMVTPDSTRVYVTNRASGSVTVIDPSTDSVISTLSNVFRTTTSSTRIKNWSSGLHGFISTASEARISVLDIDPTSPSFHQSYKLNSEVIFGHGDEYVDGSYFHLRRNGRMEIIDLVKNSPTYRQSIGVVSIRNIGENLNIVYDRTVLSDFGYVLFEDKILGLQKVE